MTVDVARIARALAGIDAWLEGMRGPAGYTGPIAHWWETNLRFTGPLFDWRYEGIIDGYRMLYVKTGSEIFLERAKRAAEDVLAAQLPDGRFRSSSFQFGPIPGGTPHEAAVDVALLLLARTMREHGLAGHQRYATAAQDNLERYWLRVLWNGQGFMDQPYNPVLVANKHATLLEALLEYGDATGRDVSEFTAACLRVIRSAFVSYGPQAGGIVHLGIGPSNLAVSIYTARSMNGLLSHYLRRRDSALLPILEGGTAFLKGLLTDEGIAWGMYDSGIMAMNPQVIAGAGDVLRFFLRGAKLALRTEDASERLTGIMLNAQSPSGGLPTARGFAAKGLARPSRVLDLRDALPVVGWVDKAFRALSLLLPQGHPLPASAPLPYEGSVMWRGKPMTFRESASQFEVIGSRGELTYAWRKGSWAPQVCDI